MVLVAEGGVEAALAQSADAHQVFQRGGRVAGLPELFADGVQHALLVELAWSGHVTSVPILDRPVHHGYGGPDGQELLIWKEPACQSLCRARWPSSRVAPADWAPPPPGPWPTRARTSRSPTSPLLVRPPRWSRNWRTRACRRPLSRP